MNGINSAYRVAACYSSSATNNAPKKKTAKQSNDSKKHNDKDKGKSSQEKAEDFIKCLEDAKKHIDVLR